MPFTILFTDSSFEDIGFMKKYMDNCETILGIDSGTDILYKSQILPNLIIGDMDSINSEVLEYYKKKTDVKIYSSKKNETDTELGLKWCIENNKKDIIIFNAMQNRLDHIQGLIANLIFAHKHGLNLKIINKNQKILCTDK